jgi:hypothetical protein
VAANSSFALTVNGSATINGTAAISGATVISESVLKTTGKSGATVNLGKLGRVELGPGGMLHVESTTARRVTNPGPEELVMLVVGGKEGYVGRDGQPAAPKAFLRDLDAD